MFVREQQTDDFFEVRDQQDEESTQSTKVSDNTIKGAIITQTLEKEVRLLVETSLNFQIELINSSLSSLKYGQSLPLSIDFYNLSISKILITLVPLNTCDVSSGAIAFNCPKVLTLSDYHEED